MPDHSRPLTLHQSCTQLFIQGCWPLSAMPGGLVPATTRGSEQLSALPPCAFDGNGFSFEILGRRMEIDVRVMFH